MHARWIHRSAGHRLPVPLCLATVAIITMLAASSCGHPSRPKSSASTVKDCGTESRTAANVPVTVQVTTGQVPCATALNIEHSYAQAIVDGKAPGNGGGGLMRIAGWNCQGFPTPVLLKTGQASKCVKGGTEILATLISPA